MVGASGAIAGVLGAYLLLFPRANVRCLIFIIIFIQMIRVPAFIVLGIWILGQFFSLPGSLDSSGGTAYLAHIGGFITGMILIPFFKKTNVRLLQEKNSIAWVIVRNWKKHYFSSYPNESIASWCESLEML